ncbi:MAG: hypothetical protein HOQ29_04995 [Acidobacteria bacterium]|nr:hypothetical protein [Acidobacteriota bacterium]
MAEREQSRRVFENAAATLALTIALALSRLAGQSPAVSIQPSLTAVSSPGAAVYNVRVVTDASPDLSDLPSFVRSATARWPSPAEKVWALFYWTHVLKRQTAPMVLHGFEVTDPIRNFSDFGYTMCSTISGINQSLYETLGLRHQYWDICNHTVTNVEYDGAFHMIDGSMSNLVTRDDGVTLASVEETAADAARLVKEHSLYTTSANGFLQGSDMMRNLADTASPIDGRITPGFANSFCSTGLKFRNYYYNWDAGHRYVLNLRQGESYTRYYHPLGSTPDYWVGSEKIAAPDPATTFLIDSAGTFGVRGNGVWSFVPDLSGAGWDRVVYRSDNIVAAGGGLAPASGGRDADVVYNVAPANAIASQTIHAAFFKSDAAARAAIAISLNHGATWTDVGSAGTAVGSRVEVDVPMRDAVNGAYGMLVRIRMRAPANAPSAVALTALAIDTITHVNARALPKLTIGRNEIVVGAGSQTDTIVLWPDLRGELWTKDVYDFRNIATQPVSVPKKFTAVAFPAVLTEDAYLTYRVDAPRDITGVTYGGRLHNYRAGSYVEFQHSFDGGGTWTPSYRLTDVSAPYDVIHYETIGSIPAGVRTVLFKFLMHNTEPSGSRPSGLYAARMEVQHQPAAPAPAALDVTLRWNEVRADRTLVQRTHRQRVSGFPFAYVVNVGGSDHPIVESLRLAVADDSDATPFGYGDGIDAGGTKYAATKRKEGTNLAKGRPYTVSRAPSGFQSSAGASNTTILTDGVVGAPQTGGISYWWGQCWSANSDVNLQVDLGQARMIGAVRAHLFGTPSWDAFRGDVQDRVEILTSPDGSNFTSQGLLQMAVWKKDLPINYMLLDSEKATAWNFERRLPAPVSARFVRYRVSPRRIVCASELQVFDRIDDEPFDLRIALPDAVPVPPPPPPPAPDDLDEIVLHAAVGPQIRGGWNVIADPSAASGARLQNPDAGAAKLATALAAPVQAFDLTFTAAAGRAYRLWLRARAINDRFTNDSVFVQFDGSVDASGAPIWRIGSPSSTTVVLEDCSGCGVQGWGWADNGYGLNVAGPVVYFATSGPQRLRVQVREDGLGIDQIVLSAVTYFTARPGATKNDTTIIAK